jgi:sugar phosphate isomerase/epimerase
MRLGMPGLIELGELGKQVELCAALGLEFVEIHMDMPAVSLSRLSPQEARRISSDASVDLTLHLPECLDLASFQDPMRDASIQIVRDALDWCHEAGVTLANMHLHGGVYFSLPDRKVFVYQHYQRDFERRLVEAAVPLLAHADSVGVNLCVENGWLQSAEPTLASLLKEHNLHLTWDKGHDGSSGYVNRGFIERHADSVAHMHLHDFVGRSNHLPLFTGELDVRAALDEARDGGWSVVIEVKTEEALRASVEALGRRGAL